MNKKILSVVLSFCLLIPCALSSIACGNTNNGNIEDKDVTKVNQTERVQELCDNIEKVPTAEDLSKQSIVPPPENKSTDNTTVQQLSLQKYNSVDDYDEIPLIPDGYEETNAYADYIGNEINQVDNLTSAAKGMKESVLKEITQYGIWVDTSLHFNNSDKKKLKVDYDVNADTLTIEEIFINKEGSYEKPVSSTQYTKLRSYYDVNDNIVIEYYSVNYIGETVTEECYKFHQNVSFDYYVQTISNNDNPDNYNFPHQSRYYKIYDFVLGENKQTSLFDYEITTNIQTNEIINSGGSVKTVGQYEDFYILYKMNLGKYIEQENSNYQTILFDKNWHHLANVSYRTINEQQIKTYINFIPLTLFNEIEKVYSENIDDVNAKLYFSANGKTYSNDNLVCQIDSSDDFNFTLCMHFEGYDDNFNEIRVSTINSNGEIIIDKTKSIYDCFATMLSSFGLTFKNGYKELFDYAQSTHDLLNNYTAFGVSDFNDITTETLTALYSKYITEHVSLEKINEYDSENNISVTEQANDVVTYNYINIKEEISVTVNTQDGKVDFSQLNVTIPKKQLFIEGNSYMIMIALTDGNIIYELDRKEVVFNNEDMTFSGFTSVSITGENLSVDKEYSLIIFFAAKVNQSYVRMTNNLNINCSPFESFTIDGTDAKLTYTLTDKILISTTEKK